MRRAPLILVVLLVSGAVPAHAAAGGQPAPSSTGGTQAGDPVSGSRTTAKRRHRDLRPVARSFAVSPGTVYAYGAPLRAGFEIRSRERTVHVWLDLLRAGERKPAITFDLGEQPVRTPVTWTAPGGATAALAEGDYVVRLRARDRHGRRLRAAARIATRQALAFHPARFPLLGDHDFGGEDARFGNDRGDHIHQGQDILAAEGTPVIAPRGGTIVFRGFQESGAGNYLVLRGDGENRDYVFMHLRDGSIRVDKGDHVRTGKRLADVGTTGRSTAPHLHFEIWVGGWYEDGGHPVDPLPDLERWDAYS